VPEFKYDTAKELEDAIEAYFIKCRPSRQVDDQGNPINTPNGSPIYDQHPPTMTGIALALGFKNRISLYEYEKRGVDFAETISRARARIEEFHEAMLARSGCTGSIFFLKNHGWIDEQMLSGGDPIRVASVSLSEDEEAAYKNNYARFFGGRVVS